MSSRFNSGDPRAPPRDRSPRDFSRRSSTYNGFRGNEPEPRPRGDSANGSTSVGREAPPRGPRADGPRGPAASGSIAAPSGPRGGGYPNPLSDAPPLTDTRDRGRGWRDHRDRDFDRRGRRPSPRGRSPPRDPRDARDYPPRDLDINRARGAARDGPPSAGSTYSDPSTSSYGRGGFGRPTRGNDWGYRGRGRGYHADDRDNYRARSRSRGPRWGDKDISRDDRDLDRRDDRRFDAREDHRRIYRDRDERDTDRYKPPARPDSRSAESRPPIAGSVSPYANPASANSTIDRRNDVESAGFREYPTSRRSSATEISGIKDTRRESDKTELPPGRTELPRERYASRGSSPPPPPPSVPAFGSFLNGPSSNVWQKPVSSGPTAIQPAGSKGIPPTAPTAPKALVVAPPTGPKASRLGERNDARDMREPGEADETRRESTSNPSPSFLPPAVLEKDLPVAASPTGSPSLKSRVAPRPPPTAPSGPRAQPQPLQDSPIPSIPSGPRNARPVATSPQAIATIPTGPRADRRPPAPHSHIGPPFTSPRPNSKQWVRPGAAPAPPFSRSTLVPAKRDSEGEEKERVPHAPARIETSHGPLQPNAVRRDNGDSANARSSLQRDTMLQTRPDHKIDVLPDDVTMRDASPVVDKAPLSAKSSAPEGGNDLSEDDDGLGLDEADFAKAERQFERDKERLESRKQDLSDRSLRAVTPLEEIAQLQAMTMADINYVRSLLTKEEDVSTEKAHSPTVDAPILTPKEEDLEDVPMQDTETRAERQLSPERDTTPDTTVLPFLTKEPLTPSSGSDYDKFERVPLPPKDQDKMLSLIRSKHEATIADLDEKLTEFSNSYDLWRLYLDQLEDERKDHGDQQQETVESAHATTPGPSATLPSVIPESRRGRHYASEYELEETLRQSARDAEEQQAQREREAKKSKPDMEKESDIPELLTKEEQARRKFKDTNCARQASRALRCYHFDPPPDDFTPEEHKILVTAYHQAQKQWGYMATFLPGRTYKECINHYYATKWDKEYKPRVGKRKGARAKAARALGANRGRAPMVNSEAITRHGISEDGTANASAVTEKGRPRRAAAPQFGQETDGEASAAMLSMKGGRTTGDGSVERGGKRSRGTKEKAPRKPRAVLAAAPTTSPMKPIKERLEKPLGVKQEDPLRAESVEEGGIFDAGPSMYRVSDIPPLYDDMTGQTMTSLSTGMSGPPMDRPRSQAGGQTRNTPSSYWSVQEQTDIRRNIAHFGTDFEAIARHMGTKTMQMVKNQYSRLIDSPNNSDLRDAAQEADRKRKSGVDMGPPPAPSAVAPRRKYDTAANPIPRPLAPNLDVDMENSPPASQMAPALSPPQPQASPRYSNPNQQSALGRAKPNPAPHTSPPMGPITSDVPQLSPTHHPHQSQYQSQPPRVAPRMGFFEQTSRPGAQALSTHPAAPPHQMQHNIAPMSSRASQVPGRQEQQRPSQIPPRSGSPAYRSSTLQQLPEAESAQRMHLPQQAQLPQERHSRGWSITDRTPYPSHGPRQGPTGVPPQPMSLPRSTGPPSSSELQARSIPAQQTPLSSLHRPQSSLGRAVDSPSRGPPSLLPQTIAERSHALFASQESRPSSIPNPAAGPPPAPPKPAAPPKRSNLDFLLNAEPATERQEPKPVKRESDQGLSSRVPPPINQAPPMQQHSSRPNVYGEAGSQSYLRQSYTPLPPSQGPSRPPSRIADPVQNSREPGHGLPTRDSWSQRAYPGTQSALTSQTNSPLSVHPPSSSLSEQSRLPAYSSAHRSMPYAQHNQPQQHMPSSPAPPHTYAHARNSSYNQQPQAPVSQAPPLRHQTPPVTGATSLRGNPYGSSQPHGASSLSLSERSHSQNMNIPYTVHPTEPPHTRGLSGTDVLIRSEHREQEQYIQRQREADMQQRQEQEQRERERDREHIIQSTQAMRYGQHTPHAEPHRGYAPPPPPPPHSGPPQQQQYGISDGRSSAMGMHGGPGQHGGPGREPFRPGQHAGYEERRDERPTDTWDMDRERRAREELMYRDRRYGR